MDFDHQFNDSYRTPFPSHASQYPDDELRFNMNEEDSSPTLVFFVIGGIVLLAITLGCSCLMPQLKSGTEDQELVAVAYPIAHPLVENESDIPMAIPVETTTTRQNHS